MPPKRPLRGHITRGPEPREDIIHNGKQQRSASLQQEPMWTVAELSGLTKYAKSTIYDWVQQEYIPHIKVRGCIRFRPSEILAWLDQHAKPGRGRRVPEVEV